VAGGVDVRSVFLGGGTPSLLPAEAMRASSGGCTSDSA
jgi:coproporphyrinogen III oxidase-like Fe-S oxidoreductase